MSGRLYFYEPQVSENTACPGSYQIRTIEYGKILVMLVYGEYYGRVYEVYNKIIYVIQVVLIKTFQNQISKPEGFLLLCKFIKKQLLLGFWNS